MVGSGRNGKNDGVAIGTRLTIGCIARTVDTVLEQPDDPVAAPPEADPPAGTAVCPGGGFPSQPIVVGVVLCLFRPCSNPHVHPLSNFMGSILPYPGCRIHGESMVSPQCLIAFCRDFGS
ncbi:hypothetical protein D3C71_1656320 [compost metagenome]